MIYSSLILRQTICLDIRENVTKRIAKAERSRDFFHPRCKQKYRVTVTIYANWSRAFCPQRQRRKTFTFAFGSLPVNPAVTWALTQRKITQ